MRAVPLVRAWLYGFRGFVVMTASLAIAFSVAITGPPTNTELDIVTEAVATRAAAFGEEIEAAAIQVCPSLPNEVQMLCGAAPAPAPAEETPPAPPKPPPPVELTANEDAVTPPPANVDADLLGAPPRVERAQPPRRAATQRTSAQRPVAHRDATPPRRATTPRRVTPARAAPQRTASDRPAAERIRAARQAAQGDLTRGLSRRAEIPSPAPPAETLSRGDDSAQVLSDMDRAMDAYAEFEAAEAAEYRREQAERREERRRRWRERRRAEYERAYGTPYSAGDHEEAPYREPERYPDDGW
ncbi:MAG: hypothetical protein AB7H66_13885 [Hyphomonadaceae bacterium]